MSKTVTLDQVTIIASNAEQQSNTDTWDDEELDANSRLNADSANSSIRTATPAKSSAIKDFTTSAKLVRNAVTFAKASISASS